MKICQISFATAFIVVALYFTFLSLIQIENFRRSSEMLDTQRYRDSVKFHQDSIANAKWIEYRDSMLTLVR